MERRIRLDVRDGNAAERVLRGEPVRSTARDLSVPALDAGASDEVYPLDRVGQVGP